MREALDDFTHATSETEREMALTAMQRALRDNQQRLPVDFKVQQSGDKE